MSDQERFRRLDALREEARRRLNWIGLAEFFGQVMATLHCTGEEAEQHIRNRLLNGLHTQWADTGRDAPYADVVWAVVEICFTKGFVCDEWGRTREWRKLWVERKSATEWLRRLAATLSAAPPVEHVPPPPPETLPGEVHRYTNLTATQWLWDQLKDDPIRGKNKISVADALDRIKTGCRITMEERTLYNQLKTLRENGYQPKSESLSDR